MSNRLKFILIIFLFPFCVAYSNAEWIMIDSLENKETQDNDLDEMYCLNSKEIVSVWRGFEVGFNQLKFTDDGGMNWRIVDIDSLGQALGMSKYNAINFNSVSLNSVCCVLSFFNNQYLISKDKGVTWELIELNAIGFKSIILYDGKMSGLFLNYEDMWSSQHDFGYIDFEVPKIELVTLPHKYKHHSMWNIKRFNENMIYALINYPCEYKEFLKIINGEWNSYKLPYGTGDVFYLDSNNLYLYGLFNDYKFIEKSKDAGQSWERIYSEFTYGEIGFSGITMLDESVGFIWVAEKLFVTKDGGCSLSEVDVPGSSFFNVIKDLQVIGNEGWLLRPDGIFYNPDMGLN